MIFMNRPVCGICGAAYDENHPERPMVGFIKNGEQMNVCYECMCDIGTDGEMKMIVPGRRRRRRDD